MYRIVTKRTETGGRVEDRELDSQSRAISDSPLCLQVSN